MEHQETVVLLNPLDRIVCVNLDISIWSGKKKLTPEDLGLSPEQTPPEELASLGQKKICDPQALAEFRRLKARAASLLAAHGVRFLSGYAVPAEKLDWLRQELAKIEQEFTAARDRFLSTYHETVADWINRHPDWAAQIRQAVEPVARVAAALSWRVTCFKVVHPGADDQGLAEEANSLGQQLLREVAQEAQETYRESFRGRDSVTRRALRPLDRIYGKLLSLSFLEPRVQPFLDLFKATLKRADRQTPVEGPALSEVKAILLVLMQPEKVVACGEPGWVLEAPENGVTMPNPELSEAMTATEECGEAGEADEESLAVQLPELPLQPPAWFF